MQNIKIVHLSGSKTNQTELFSWQDRTEISFGRNEQVDVKFDPDRDDLVSRNHARISQDSENKTAFTITDLNSRNGTFVNGVRITGTISISHGDIVQFGTGGPEFRLELDPPPDNVSRQTRFAAGPTRLPGTREVPSSVFDHQTANANVPRPEGRLTMLEKRLDVEKNVTEDRMAEEKIALRKHLINVVAGILGVVALVASVLIYRDWHTQQQLDETKNQLAISERSTLATGAVIKEIKAVMTPRQIAEKYTRSTVSILYSWKLADTSTGQQLYHQHYQGNPFYVQLTDGTIQPLLTTESENGSNPAIGSDELLTGSGFLVDQNGFIMTSRHVAAPWMEMYYSRLPGMLIILNNNGEPQDAKVITSSPSGENYIAWLPNNAKLFGRKNTKKSYRTIVGKNAKTVEGRHDKLSVTFAQTKLPIPAEVARVSDSTDAALLKIQVPDLNVDKVNLSDDDNVNPGDRITVMGYPEGSAFIGVRVQTQNSVGGGLDVQDVEVPDPTIADGSIARVFKVKGVAKSTLGYFSSLGDVYQLAVNATGKENSGGPVFDEHGYVIGIYSYQITDINDTRVTYAVPIKHGRELMDVKQVIDR